MDERLKAKDEALRTKLLAMPTDEAEKFFKQFEEVVRTNVGSYWKPLTPLELSALSREVSSIEKRRISIMHKNSLGKNLAKSLVDAFETAGWEVHFSVTADFEDGIVVGRSPTVAVQIKGAIERATPLTVTYLPLTEAWGDDNQFSPVFIGVGINTAPYQR